MKNLVYILILLLIVSCKNEAIKSESADLEIITDTVEETVNSSSLEDIGTQKLNEYFELLKLKQQHPEFESDINAQLSSFTKDSLLKNYEDRFTISNIQQTGERTIVSDSVEIFTLKYTVTTKNRVFEDSIKTHITTGTDYLESVESVSLKKVRFSRFE